MTPSQIRLLKKSFTDIEPINAEVGTCFYDKLFEIAPETRRVFAPDTEPQWRKLMNVFEKLITIELRSMLTVPVTNSGSKEISIPAIAELAGRYAERGAKPEYFEPAKTALLWSLEHHLGEDFDDDTAFAWEQAFDVIASSMVSVIRSEAVEPIMPYDRPDRQ